MTPLTYASLCSGIEAAHLALSPAGFTARWFSDIDPFASALLAHHYPHTPNHGDMLTLAPRIQRREIDAPALLCAGTPCQSFSTIGQRASLTDPRGHLTLATVHILNTCDHARHLQHQPGTVLLWENVIGILSAHGNAFGHYLAALAGTRQPLINPRGADKSWPGAGTAWRTLDAQYFNLPQQRRRIFLVASPARSHLDPAEVLFVACHPWRPPFGPTQASSKISPGNFLSPASAAGMLKRCQRDQRLYGKLPLHPPLIQAMHRAAGTLTATSSKPAASAPNSALMYAAATSSSPPTASPAS